VSIHYQLERGGGNKMDMANLEDLYPLSPMQQGMLYHSIKDKSSGMYFEQYSIRITGPFNLEAFKLAWKKIITIYPIFRTTFHWRDLDTPLQAVHKNAELLFEYEDFQHLSKTEKEELFQSFLEADRDKNFDLQKAPLMRIYIYQTESDEYLFTWSFHHLLVDAWSVDIVLQKVFDFYQNGMNEEDNSNEISLPFREYIHWLLNQDPNKTEDYWKEYFKEVNEPSLVFESKNKSTKQTHHYVERQHALSKSISSSIVEFSKTNRLTVNTLIQAAWSVLLSRYNGGNRQALFGTTVSGRSATLDGIESMVGMLINTIPVCVDVDPHMPLVNWLKSVQTKQFESSDFDFASLMQVKEWSGLPNQVPLFDSIVIFENQKKNHTWLQQTDLNLEIISNVERTNYPISLILTPGECFTIRLIYDQQIFSEQQIENLITHFSNLLQGIVENKADTVLGLTMLSSSEHQKIVHQWSGIQTDYPKHQSIPEIFEQVVNENPHQIALSFAETSLTYSELNKQVNVCYKFLRRNGVESGELVAIYLERSIELIVCILAILKLGAAYLPLDAKYPAKRLRQMIDESQVKHLLTCHKLEQVIPSSQASLLFIEDIKQQPEDDFDALIEPGVHPDRLAYIMYTSGSTGKPKGVCVTHKNIVRLVKNTNYVELNRDDVFLQLAPIAFDASTFEIWGALLNGGTLVIMPPGTPSLKELGNTIRKNQITTLWLTAGLFHLMVDEQIDSLANLKNLLAGGDILSPSHVRKALQHIQGNVINGYGPTENTTFSCCCVLSESMISDSVPIGKPIANSTAYILDQNLMPVPTGITGELYVGGDGLSPGYFKNQQLSDERFIPNPFEADSRLYRTGDLAYFLNDGNIKFVGRCDNQVKVRGFRIELAEVEAAFSIFPDLNQVAAMVIDDGNQGNLLVAYFSPEKEKQIEESILRQFLSQQLPEYMIPSKLVQMPSLPLTENGKIDRKALKIPVNSSQNLQDIEQTNDQLELQLTRIWEKLLNHRPINRGDNFFDLGGNSLHIVRLFGEIEKQFKTNIPISALTQMPTIKQLASAIRNEGWTPTWTSLVPIQAQGSGVPIFCVPPIGMTAFAYVDLAKYLPGHPIFAIQAVGLEMDDRLPKSNINEIVSHYVKEIQSLQKNGPYYIAGACYGATFAYEIAQQLIQQGEQVATLALFDPGPVAPKRCPNLIQQPISFVSHLYQRFHFLRQRKELFETLYENIVARQISRVKGIFIPQEKRILMVMDAHLEAMSQYQVKTYPGQIQLFLSRKKAQTEIDEDPIIKQWTVLPDKGLQIKTIPGKHLDLLYEPKVEYLAEHLRPHLNVEM